MTPKSKKESNTLVRVRNNQRRCRARRREYIAELERKLQDLEALGAEVGKETSQSTVARLQDENTRLRYLLGLAGFSETWVAAHLKQGNDGRENANTLQDSHQDTVVETQDEAIDYSETVPQATMTVLTPETYGPGISAIPDDLFDVPFELSGRQFNFFIPSLLPVPVDLPPTSKSCKEKLRDSSCCPKPADKQSSWASSSQIVSHISLSQLKSLSLDSDSTLCSVAFSLVRQHNKKGVDMIEIGIRLWNGFIKGDPAGAGCKVENKLLFSVLEYISS